MTKKLSFLFIFNMFFLLNLSAMWDNLGSSDGGESALICYNPFENHLSSDELNQLQSYFYELGFNFNAVEMNELQETFGHKNSIEEEESFPQEDSYEGESDDFEDSTEEDVKFMILIHNRIISLINKLFITQTSDFEFHKIKPQYKEKLIDDFKEEFKISKKCPDLRVLKGKIDQKNGIVIIWGSFLIIFCVGTTDVHNLINDRLLPRINKFNILETCLNTVK